MPSLHKNPRGSRENTGVNDNGVKVALYARVSTKDQDTENQLIRLRAVATLRGYDVVAEFEDEASGANPNRPALDAMLLIAKKRQIDKIVAVKLDRLARSVINLAQLVGDLERWGVDLELLDQQIDTATASGRFMFTILSAVAEYERELIGDRTRDGLAKAVKSGKKLGRPKTQFSAYQKQKLERLLAEDPSISIRALHAHFEGIGRTVFSQLLREGGYR